MCYIFKLLFNPIYNINFPTCIQYKTCINEVLYILAGTKSLKFGVYFVLTVHLISVQLLFKGSVATCEYCLPYWAVRYQPWEMDLSKSPEEIVWFLLAAFDHQMWHTHIVDKEIWKEWNIFISCLFSLIDMIVFFPMLTLLDFIRFNSETLQLVYSISSRVLLTNRSNIGKNM